jgi:hypothetical protein
MTFFTELEKSNPKIHMEVQKTPHSQKAILSKSNNSGHIAIPDLYYRKS